MGAAASYGNALDTDFSERDDRMSSGDMPRTSSYIFGRTQSSLSSSYMIFKYGADGSFSLCEPYISKYEALVDVLVARPIVTIENGTKIQEHLAALFRGTSAYDPSVHASPAKFLYSTFYTKLFEVDPKLRPLFRSSVNAQGNILLGKLNIMANINTMDSIVQTAADLGLSHRNFGARREHFFVVGRVLLETLETASGTCWTPELKAAYSSAWSFVTYLMAPVLTQSVEVSNASLYSLKPSISVKIISTENITQTVKRIKLEIPHILRFFPGDALLLGIPIPSKPIQFRRYAIVNFRAFGAQNVDIIVENCSETSNWLCSQLPGELVDFYWVESPVTIEVDVISSLPANALFISFGIGYVPFLSMIQALHSVRQSYNCESVTLINFAEDTNNIKATQSLFDFAGVWSELKIHHLVANINVGVNSSKIFEIVPDFASREVYISCPKYISDVLSQLYLAKGGISHKVKLYSYENHPPPGFS